MPLIHFSIELWLSIIVKPPGNQQKPLIHVSKFFQDELKNLDPSWVKIHFHCFNYNWRVAQNWMKAFPNTKFGFTGLLLYQHRHFGLDEVVKKLHDNQILLETDAPYLSAPVHRKCDFNSPYGIEEVAARVAQLRGQTLQEVLVKAVKSTRAFYSLY